MLDFDETLHDLLDSMLWGDAALRWHSLEFGMGKRSPYLLFSRNMSAEIRYEASEIRDGRLFFGLVRKRSRRPVSELVLNLQVEPTLERVFLNKQLPIRVRRPPMLVPVETGEWIAFTTRAGEHYSVRQTAEQLYGEGPYGEFYLNPNGLELDDALGHGRDYAGMMFITDLIDAMGDWRTGEWTGPLVQVGKGWDGGIGPALRAIASGYVTIANFFDGSLPDPRLTQSLTRLARKHPVLSGAYTLAKAAGKLKVHLGNSGRLMQDTRNRHRQKVEFDIRIRPGTRVSGLDINIRFPDFLVAGKFRDKLLKLTVDEKFDKLWKSVDRYVEEPPNDGKDGNDDDDDDDLTEDVFPSELTKPVFRDFVNQASVRNKAYIVRIAGDDEDLLELRGYMLNVEVRLFFIIKFKFSDGGHSEDSITGIKKVNLAAAKWGDKWFANTYEGSIVLAKYVFRLLSILALWQASVH